MTGGAGVEGEESNLPVLVPLLPRRFRRGVDRVPLAWTKRLPRPPQLHHLFQAVQALHHGNSPFKKKADASDSSYGSPQSRRCPSYRRSQVFRRLLHVAGAVTSLPLWRRASSWAVEASTRAVGVYRDVVNGPRVSSSCAQWPQSMRAIKYRLEANTDQNRVPNNPPVSVASVSLVGTTYFRISKPGRNPSLGSASEFIVTTY